MEADVIAGPLEDDALQVVVLLWPVRCYVAERLCSSWLWVRKLTSFSATLTVRENPVARTAALHFVIAIRARRGIAAEAVDGGSHVRRAASFARMLISA